MTVIVGVEANTEPVAVLATDRLGVFRERDLVMQVALMHADQWVPVEELFGMLESSPARSMKLVDTTKIQSGKDHKTLLAGTGTRAEFDRFATMLLLDEEAWLREKEIIEGMLFPFGYGCTADNLAFYKKGYNLDTRLQMGSVPEIRQLANIFVVRRIEIPVKNGSFFRWDRNYNTNLSEYLYIRRQDRPNLYEITVTGTAVHRQYYARGAGGGYALDYLREQLGTEQGFFGQESNVHQEIDGNRAIELATGAISYANKKSPFCEGLDYAVMVPSGVELHLSDEKISRYVPFRTLIKDAITRQQQKLGLLQDLQEAYTTYMKGKKKN